MRDCVVGMLTDRMWLLFPWCFSWQNTPSAPINMLILAWCSGASLKLSAPLSFFSICIVVPWFSRTKKMPEIRRRLHPQLLLADPTLSTWPLQNSGDINIIKYGCQKQLLIIFASVIFLSPHFHDYQIDPSDQRQWSILCISLSTKSGEFNELWQHAVSHTTNVFKYHSLFSTTDVCVHSVHVTYLNNAALQPI